MVRGRPGESRPTALGERQTGRPAGRETAPTRRSSVTHTCPIGQGPPLTAGDLVVDEGWCFDAWSARVAAVPDTRPEHLWPPPGWSLWADGRMEIAYTAMDWVNPLAEVVLIGITPGRHQAWEAAREAGRALRAGADPEEALRRADRAASFSGAMRANLVSMLDGIGLAAAMGLRSSSSFFGPAHRRCGLVSATGFPVFVEGRNYTGSAPVLADSPVLRSLVCQMLGGDLRLTPHALLVPLGTAAQSAVDLLVAEGIIEAPSCLRGLPHPSGANGHRARQYAERADRLRVDVAAWAASSPGRQTGRAGQAPDEAPSPAGSAESRAE